MRRGFEIEEEKEIKRKFKKEYKKIRGNEKGHFFPEIPIGKLFVNDKNEDYKWIDLLFIKEEDSKKYLPKETVNNNVTYGDKNVLNAMKKICSDEVMFKPQSSAFKNFMKYLEGKSVKIFEAKQQLDWESIGQILAYRVIFLKEHPKIKIEEIWIVYERGDKILEKVCEELEIKLRKITIEKTE